MLYWVGAVFGGVLGVWAFLEGMIMEVFGVTVGSLGAVRLWLL